MEEERRKARTTRKRLGQLKKRLPTVFQARDLAEAFRLSCNQARRMLAYWAKTGRVRRVSFGFYTVANRERCLDFAISVAATRFKAGYLAGTAAAVRAKLLQRRNYALGLTTDEAIDWILPYRVARRFVRVAGHWFARMTQRPYVDRGVVPRCIANAIVPCASRERSVADALLWADCWAGTVRRTKVFRRHLAVTPPSRDHRVAEIVRQIFLGLPGRTTNDFLRWLGRNSLCSIYTAELRELRFLAALDEERFRGALRTARRRKRRGEL